MLNGKSIKRDDPAPCGCTMAAGDAFAKEISIYREFIDLSDALMEIERAGHNVDALKPKLGEGMKACRTRVEAMLATWHPCEELPQ